jgi:hypothetical protein
MVYQHQGRQSTQNYLQRKKVDHRPWRWYTIVYIFSIVDNFELIISLDVGMPLFIFLYT